ncbi:MAG TPA: aminotransferase class V-fold PLP-dependent enzyme [Bacillus bacterium]|uniref:Aminotransferase class V domain-containing protein n=1 Tax=Siminovitchia fordii TaxID=254759 RepID=A0ABQ4K8U7_9BACI|nr:hypothetical protein J1TS3_32830 [Siminovitchia fordii]HBZ09352.1 aminotransferase class V-fold PLP-dependent enzyme [Bacillus sp. (in: firmicutes)]
MAEDKGLSVKWIKVNPETLILNLDDLDEVINENTKLVAIGLASNAVGNINDVSTISKKAREVGVLVAVDTVHAVPHIPVDRDKLGAELHSPPLLISLC